MSALLSLAGVGARYGAARALHGVDLHVGAGEAVALMGRNGMGKTTTIRAICRMTPPDRGEIRFAGRDLAGLRSDQVARLGIGLAPEGRRCFADLTVRENLAAAARPGPDGARDWDADAAARLFPRLGERMGQRAGSLSGGEQQMLAIGRALTTNPRLLILDEATEGLAPVVRAEIWAAIRKLRGEGLAILIVDKTLAELAAIADRCVVLERGATAWTGPPEALDAEVRARWLGV